MARLTMTLGLPGSGKSTWAANEKLRDLDTIVVVNKDTIRRELEAKGWVWSREAEADVIRERNRLIMLALQDDKDVISDDTNLAPRHQNDLKQLANKARARFEVKDFRDIPLATCVERDALREGKARVGRDVIVKMATTYLNYQEPPPKFAPYTPQDGLPPVILCDLDGTLSLFEKKGHRGPYDASKADEDEVNEPVLALIMAMLDKGIKLIFMSGREDKFRAPTLAFLAKIGLDTYPLYMRKTGDTRKDWIIKGELFDANVRGKFNVTFCLDDRDQVVNFYRGLGLTVLQVAPGAF